MVFYYRDCARCCSLRAMTSASSHHNTSHVSIPSVARAYVCVHVRPLGNAVTHLPLCVAYLQASGFRLPPTVWHAQSLQRPASAPYVTETCLCHLTDRQVLLVLRCCSAIVLSRCSVGGLLCSDLLMHLAIGLAVNAGGRAWQHSSFRGDLRGHRSASAHGWPSLTSVCLHSAGSCASTWTD